jgi:hypothetical protein
VKGNFWKYVRDFGILCIIVEFLIFLFVLITGMKIPNIISRIFLGTGFMCVYSYAISTSSGGFFRYKKGENR